MFRKVCLSLIMLLSVLLLARTAHAGLAALSYTDTNSESVTVGPAQQWINPTGEMSVYLTGGLERKVGYVLLDAGGHAVAEAVSDSIITGADQFTVLDQTYYGKVLTIPSGLSEGDYTLKARIFDGQGVLVSSQDIVLTVDRTPPEAGDLWWYAYGCDCSIMNNELVGTFESRYIKVHEVSDAIGVSRVQFESFYPDSGQVYKSTAACYNAAAEEAVIGDGTNGCINNNLLPPIDGPLGVRFIVYDKAGNKTVAQATVRYNGQHNPAPELIAIYNPNVTTEFIPGSGLVGFEAYTPGMTTYANPVQLLYRLARANWVGDNPDYGLDVKGGTQVYLDSDYVYFKITRAYSSYPQYDNTYSFYSPRYWLTHYSQFDLVLADTAPQSPNFVSWETYQSDIGWSGLATGDLYRKFNTPVVISKIRVVVEPRDYPQVFVDPGSGSCTIPAGATECTLNTNITENPGNTSLYHTYCYVKKDDGSLQSPYKHTALIYDLQPPSITSYNLDRSSKTVTFLADELNAGAIWGSVRVASGWVMAHNLVTGEDVKVNGTVTALGGTTYQIDTNYASLPEGNWQFTLWAKDYYGNTGSLSAETVVLDQTAPQVGVYKDAVQLADHGEVTSLGQISITLSDNVDQNPELTSVRLEGGPQGETVTLTHRPQGGTYVLEYPVMFPSQGQEYNLVVSALDASGNVATRTVPFNYVPPQVNLSSLGHETLNLPVLPANVVHADGTNALVSEAIEVEDTPISGTYDLLVVVGSSATTAVVVNGVTVAPGEQKTLPGYDFAASGGKLDLPVRSDTPGQADLLITSAAPNFPVLTAGLNFWQPELELSPDPGWEVQPIVQTQRINVLKKAGTPCRVTMDEQEAQAADPINDPACLVEWEALPPNYQTADNYVEGVLPPTGSYNANYKVYLYNNGQRYQVAAGGHALDRMPIQNVEFTAAATPAAASYYRKVQKVDVGLQSSGSFTCPAVVTALAEAQAQGAEQVVCYLRWLSVPEGLAATSSNGMPGLTGKIAQLGEQQVAWAVDLYSPYGMAENVTTGSLPLTVVDPPLPTLSFEPGIYGEEIEDPLYATSELRGGTVGAIRFATELLRTDMTLELTGTDEGDTSKKYWSANAITFSRYIKAGQIGVWESRNIKAKLYYTDLPELAVEKQISVMGVPSKRIRAVLTAPRETLDTTGVPVRLAVGIPASGNTIAYDAEQDGNWRARFGYLDRKNQFQELTDYQALTGGVLENTLTGFEAGFQKLIAQVDLVPPESADFYARTIKSNPVYSVILKGTAPEGQIYSRSLTGPAPLTSVMSLQVDSDTRRILGDVEWQMSSDGGTTWEPIEAKSAYQASVTVNPGRYLVRAKMSNRLSGAEGYSEGVEVIAFQVPELVLTSPRAVIVGTPVTLNAQVLVDGQPQEDAVVEWYDREKKLVHTGASLDLTPEVTESLIYQVQARLASAPAADSMAWVRGNIYVRVVPPSAPRGRIEIPSYMEYNTVEPQTYQLTAQTILATGLDPEMYPVQGEWHLPDGRIVEGAELEYSPTAEDAENRRALFEYVAWIEGFKAQTMATLKRSVIIKTYSWPDFLVEVKAYPDVAPSLVTLTAVPEEGTPGSLENPTYSWQLPAAAQIVRKQDNSRVLQVNFPDPGSFEVTVDIVDARGSTAQATGTVTLGEPEPFVVEFMPLYSNNLKRELLDVTLRTRVTGGHPRDRLVDYVFSIDSPDAEIAGYAGTGIFKGLRHGDYVAHLEATSKLGKVVEADFPISVASNQLPTCEISTWDDALGYRWYKAVCSDEDGRIAGYRWYLDDKLISSGQTIRQKINELTGTLRFESFDDAGGTYSETLSSPSS